MVHRASIAVFLFAALFTCSGHGALAGPGPDFEAIFRAKPDGSTVQQVVPVNVAEGRGVLAVSPQFIYWLGGSLQTPIGTFPFLRRATPTGANVQDLFEGPSSLGGLAVDAAAAKLYATPQSDCLPGCTSIVRWDLDAENPEVLFPAGFPQAIAVDPTDERVCWADLQVNEIDNVIACATVADPQPQVVVVDSVEGIAIDPVGSKLYWIVEDEIRRSDLDGSNVETLVDRLEGPFAITLDPASNRMWWTETRVGRIQSANLDGTDVQIVFEGIDSPTAIAFFDAPGGAQGDWIYWMSVSAAPVPAVSPVGAIGLVLLSIAASSMMLIRRRRARVGHSDRSGFTPPAGP